MSIHVLVKNTDSREGAIIKVQAVTAITNQPVPGGARRFLKGGEEATILIHGDQDIHITEIYND